ncbi:hypothetical protein PFISCL1PPCAC_6560 [Pristionchus fissidentatus]|uniref:E3 ubiquitin-protein ligase RNF170 n=1 Tax=Pristionchus fissidentatus TaxID=1538716 RepID=A0AAV5VAI6_9BILA|nr:hypothetical protein PFISCL1PPCAC_6560 [Pristionchus fissidentatus]
MDGPDVHHEDRDSRILEGVSNDVVIFVIAAFSVTLCVLIFAYLCRNRVIVVRNKRLWLRRCKSESNIHPELAEQIREYREIYERVNAPLPDENGVRRIIDGRSRSDGGCPICLDVSRFPVLTDCGHSFCCGCIIGYWQHLSTPLTAVNCAVCRAQVTMLLPISWPEAIEDAHEADALHEANLKVDDYNRRFSGEREWYSYITDIPVLIPYLIQHFTAYGAMVGMFRLRAYITIACILIYVLCPIDIVSERIYGVLGFLDDAFMALVALIYICVALRSYMQRRGEVPVQD